MNDTNKFDVGGSRREEETTNVFNQLKADVTMWRLQLPRELIPHRDFIRLLELIEVAEASARPAPPLETPAGTVVCLRRYDPVLKQIVFEPLPEDRPAPLLTTKEDLTRQSSPCPTCGTGSPRSPQPEGGER